MYDKLGYGFFESVYCRALELELRRRGHKVVRELVVPVDYEDMKVGKFGIGLVRPCPR